MAQYFSIKANITDFADDIISYIGQLLEAGSSLPRYAWRTILERSADPRVQTHSSKGLRGDTSPACCTLWEDHPATWSAPWGCHAGISSLDVLSCHTAKYLRRCSPHTAFSPSVPWPRVHAANLVLGPLLHTQFLPLQSPTVLHS
jgi:hypothetical protein